MTKSTSASGVAVVVNDDSTQLEALCGLVREVGLEPMPFTGAEAALAAVNPRTPPALIVTGLGLSGLDGCRFCRLLRSPEYGACNEVPIMVVSATFASDHPERIAADIEADAFLPSPVDGKAFVAQAQALLRGKEVRRRPAVLIAQDDPDLAALLVETFVAHGYRADTASTADEAGAAFARTAYDLAVLDCQLPDGRGAALLDAFRARRPDCVCILMTPDPTLELALDWMKRGAAAYLRKPFAPEVLIELCARAGREHARLCAEDLLKARAREFRNNRVRLENLLEATGAGAWEWNVQTGETILNERWAEIVGYTLAELSPVSIETWEALAHPEDLRRSGELLARHFAGELPYYDCDCRMQHKDGRWVWVHDHGKVTSRSADGKPLWMSGTHLDIDEQKRAEATLRQTESRYRAFFAQGSDGVVILDMESSKIIEFNDQACRQLGYTRDEFACLSVTDIEASESPQEVARHIRKVQKAGIDHFETRHRTKQGEIRDVQVIAQVIEAGQSSIYHCIWRDITERKRAEDALREYQKRLADIIQFLPDATLAIDRDKRVIVWNKAIEEMTGTPAAAMIGQGDYAYTIPFYGERRSQLMDLVFEHSAETAARYPQITRQGDTLTAEFFCNALYSNQGAWIFAKAAPLFNASGKVVGAIESIRDITERKRAETMVQEAQRQLSTLMANLPGVAYRCANLPDWPMNFISEGCLALTGYSQADMMRNQPAFGELIVPEHRQKVWDEVKVALSKRQHFELVYQIASAQKELRWVWERGRGVFDKDGNLLCLEGFITDITERKRAEAEKEKLQAQLLQAQKMESVGRLAGGVAHDFNNMLQAILGNTALTLEELPPESPARECLVEVQKCAQRSADLTRQLLAFARKQTIAPQVLDLNETVAGMLKMLRRLIGEDIDLAWLPGADLGRVNIDPSQVDQVLANLCVNARDAIGGGVGKVTIETANVVFDEAYLANHPEAKAGEYVRLGVSDDGCGMSPEVKEHLFEPFFTTKGLGQGTGLGLATVYGIVRQNHGFVSVHSEPGRGTTFLIHLPRYVARTVSPTGEAAPPRPARGHETILLVEDEPSILRLNQRLLRSLGYQVLAAPTPGQAIQLACEHVGEIHLLLTDVVMPEMNGRDLAKNLLNYYPNLKRLFMSGYTADVIAHHGVLDPGVHFVQKPFSIQTLADKVREVLGE